MSEQLDLFQGALTHETLFPSPLLQERFDRHRPFGAMYTLYLVRRLALMMQEQSQANGLVMISRRKADTPSGKLFDLFHFCVPGIKGKRKAYYVSVGMGLLEHAVKSPELSTELSYRDLLGEIKEVMAQTQVTEIQQLLRALQFFVLNLPADLDERFANEIEHNFLIKRTPLKNKEVGYWMAYPNPSNMCAIRIRFNLTV